MTDKEKQRPVVVLSSETSGVSFPEDTKAYASHHGAAFEQINEDGCFAFVELHETTMDRGEDGSLKQLLDQLRRERDEAQAKIESAIDTLQRWHGGYQDKCINAVKILKGKDQVTVENRALFSMIIERPDPTLDWNKPVCPSCGSSSLQEHGGEHTCIGWFPKVPEDNTPDCPGNPNLSSCQYTCEKCKTKFIYYVKYGNIWVEKVTDKGIPNKLVKGLPNTASGRNATYTCVHCVKKAVKVEENERKYKYIVAPVDEENPPYLICCLHCDAKVASHFDCYHHPYTYKNAFSDVEGPIKFSVKPGTTVINSRAIQKPKENKQ